MAIAKRNVSVSRGYKPKHARAPRSPHVWRRAAHALGQNARAALDFACDEIAYATADTQQLLDYMRYALRRETQTRLAPARRELETFAHEHETLYEAGAFAAETANALRVGVSPQ